jgi:hypothetical protein
VRNSLVKNFFCSDKLLQVVALAGAMDVSPEGFFQVKNVGVLIFDMVV